jgi:hypothetical protein
MFPMRIYSNKTWATWLACVAMAFLLIGPMLGNVHASQEDSFVDVICSANGIKLIESDITQTDSPANLTMTHCEFCNFAAGKAIDSKHVWPSFAANKQAQSFLLARKLLL